MEEAWFWGVRVGFGGREGALASGLICMYVCMYTMILPLHFSVPIYSPWQKKKKKKKHSKNKKRRWALARARIGASKLVTEMRDLGIHVHL